MLNDGKVIPKRNSLLLDVRNIYETRIGKFVAPTGGLKTIDPQTRKVIQPLCICIYDLCDYNSIYIYNAG